MCKILILFCFCRCSDVLFFFSFSPIFFFFYFFFFLKPSLLEFPALDCSAVDKVSIDVEFSKVENFGM